MLVDRVRRQRYDQCQQGYSPERAITHPQTPADFYIRGVRYTLARRYRAALGDYNQAIALDEDFSEAYLRRAEVRYLMGDDSGVLADCQRAIALNSIESRTYFYQGMARYRLNYVQSAIAAFSDAITCDPEDAQYYYRRGLAHQDLHQIDEAAKDFRRAAWLYREQGQVGSYHQLQQYLKQFGTAGRSRPIKFLGHIAQHLTDWRPHWLAGPKNPQSVRASRHRRTSDLSIEKTIKNNKLAPRFSDQPNPTRRPVDHGIARDNLKNTAKNAAKNATNLPGRWPTLSGQAYWAPGVSSRPDHDYRPYRRFRWPTISSVTSMLKLLSNPAGEMLPLYYRLSHRQTSLVGYGLAVLANLMFVLGGVKHTTESSWLVASQLWASGAMMFVSMVLVVALTRLGLRVRSLWVADMFILGTTMLPLGILTVISAITRLFVPQLLSPSSLWMADAFLLAVLLWAIAQSLITLYSGVSHIHTFSEKLSAWFAPVVFGFRFGNRRRYLDAVRLIGW